MAKNHGAQGARMNSVQMVEKLAQKVAEELGLELVEVTLQKESRGKCLCLYVDKDGGITLDDCERFHKQVQPLFEDVDYDIMEVSSPGVDRPIKNMRDFERHKGDMVEVKLFAPVNGSKLYQGALTAMDDATVAITDAEEQVITFERKAVAIIKPMVDLEEEDFADVVLDEE
ncbi:MAG: ribosome maturation factor RimP [Clostridia bacterium]|nr:ribosome maturation factor RimP [Clostridia bacterium]